MNVSRRCHWIVTGNRYNEYMRAEAQTISGLRQAWPQKAGLQKALQTLSLPDHRLMRRINRWNAPRWVFSFPSGHFTTAFTVAVSLGSFFPETLPVLLILAANIAASRVVVGMHFLSDVLVGSGLGAGLGYAAFRIAV